MIWFILGDSSSYKVKFDDPRVCKSFLLGCCPHDILASTVSDIHASYFLFHFSTLLSAGS